MLLLLLFSLSSVSSTVIGIDFGSELLKTSLIRPGKRLVIVENEQSKRSTPSALSFTDQGREYGYNALREQSKRPESTILFSHNLLGVPLQSPSYFTRTAQPLNLTENLDRNSTVITIGKERFEVEEITAMILEHVKSMTEKFGEGSITDCSITVPSFWTRGQRIAVINAAQAAGLNVLALIHENTGAAFYYAIDRLDNETDHYALFYNLGASYLQVSLAKYSSAKKNSKQIENVEVLAHAYDKELGGSLFDKLITDLLVKKFEEKHQVDLTKVPKAMVRVVQQANAAKKTLSANKQLTVIINSLYKGIDFSYTLSREEFESLIQPYSERLIAPVLKVLENAGVEISRVDSFEIIGGVSRVPKVQEILKERLGKDISTHLNGDESMAHGAAIYAANFSSVVQVKPLWLTDVSTKTYVARFFSNSDPEWKKETVLFKEGTKLGNRKKITFNFNKDVDVVIEELLGEERTPLCVYEVRGVQDIEKNDLSLYFTFVLDYSGIPFLNTAEAKYEQIKRQRKPLIETEAEDDQKSKEEQVPAKDEETGGKAANETEDKTAEETEGKTTEETGGTTAEETQGKKAEDTEGKKVNEEEKSETDETKTEENKENSLDDEKRTESNEKNSTSEGSKNKTETKTVTLKLREFELEFPKTLGSKDVSRIIKRLESFKEAEIQVKKIAEARNDLEAYIYYASDKLEEESFLKVSSSEERESISDTISSLKDWIESSEFDGSSAYEYKKRKRDLEAKLSDALQREHEHENRQMSTEKAYKDLGRMQDALDKLNQTKPWLPQADVKVAYTKLNETLKWIETKTKEQETLEDWQPLAFRISELETKVSSVEKQLEKLKRMTKPKPKKNTGPEGINFGDNFDWSKVKMEGVKIDGKEYNYDPEKDGVEEVGEDSSGKVENEAGDEPRTDL